jgi:hypothetical protein
MATDQPGQLAAREQREPCTLGRELRVGVSAEAQRHSDDIAVEADRSVEIADEQDRVAKTGRHASMFAPADASTAPLRRARRGARSRPVKPKARHSAPSERRAVAAHARDTPTSPAGRGRTRPASTSVLLRTAGEVAITARGAHAKLSRTRRHRRDRARAGTCGRTSGAGLFRTTASASGSSSASSGSHHAPSSSRVAVSPAPFWMRLVAVRKHKPLSIGPRALPVI